jgi:hypothetical protein
MSKPKILLFDEMEDKDQHIYDKISQVVELDLRINHNYNCDLNGFNGIVIHSPDYLSYKEELCNMLDGAKKKKLPVFLNVNSLLGNSYVNSYADLFEKVHYKDIYYSTNYGGLYNQIKEVFGDKKSVKKYLNKSP